MSFGLTFFGDIIVFIMGYVASAYTWVWLKSWWTNVDTEIANLEAKLSALKAAIGATATPPKT